MKRIRKILPGILLAAVVLAAVLHLVDYAFLKYEKAKLLSYARVNDSAFQLSEMRFNDHVGEIPREKKDGEYRILFFGDSYTHGITTPAFTLAADLEGILNSMGTGERNVRVVNLGVPSTSFDSYIEQFVFWTSALEYDAVVIQVYCGNDFREAARRPFEPDALAARLKEVCSTGISGGMGNLLPRESYFRFWDYLSTYWLISRYELKQKGKLQGGVPQTHLDEPQKYGPYYVLEDEDFLENMRMALEAYNPERLMQNHAALEWLWALMRTLSQTAENGKKILVMVSAPQAAVSVEVRARVEHRFGKVSGGFDPELPGTVVGEMAKLAGLPGGHVVDMIRCMGERTDRDALVYVPHETHWSVEGNEMAARLLAGRILWDWFGKPSESALPPCKPDTLDPGGGEKYGPAVEELARGFNWPGSERVGCGG